MPTSERAHWRVPRTILSLLAAASLVSTSLLPATTARAETTTQTIPAAAATYTHSAHRSIDHAARTSISVTRSAYRGYLQFDTTGLDRASLTKAELLLTPRKLSRPKWNVRVVVRSTDLTSVAGLTAANGPKPGQVVGKSTRLKTGQQVAIKLGLAAVREGTTVLNIRLNKAKAWFYESGANGPQLRLTSGSASQTSTPAPEAVAGPAVTPYAMADKPVFAHYFPPYPISIDNKAPADDYYTRHYLNPLGENGKFLAVGGLLRDRPIPQDPIGGDWRLENMKTEVRQAMAAGINGFAVDILNTTPGNNNWEATKRLLTAAAAVSPDFKVMLQPDMTASTGGLSADVFAERMASLAGYPAAYQRDGKLVLSPFKTEAKTVAWWTNVMNIMKNTHGVPTALLPLFLNSSYMSTFSPISFGFGDWGARNPKSITNGANRAAAAHNLGKLWMHPVGWQDVRPSSSRYDEAGNTETLRLSWQRAINDGADMVLLVTWNDYSETTSFAPSMQHGWSILDLSKRYLTRFQTGSYPAITQDALYLSHRLHSYLLKPTSQTSLMQPWSGDRTPPRDTVEVLSVLTAPGKVKLAVGARTYAWDAPAGVYTKLVPLSTGSVSASLTRNGQQVTAVKTPKAVKSSIATQDLGYQVATSLRPLPRQS